MVIGSLALLVTACGRAPESPGETSTPPTDVVATATIVQVPMRHAETVDLQAMGDIKLLTVKQPWRGASQPVRYVLVPRESTVPRRDALPADFADAPVIRVPVQRVVTLANPFLPAFDLCDRPDVIVGHSRPEWIRTASLARRVAAGEITDVSAGGGQVDLETLVALQPDLVLANAIGDAESDVHLRLQQHGVPVVLVADYMEPTPLGRAEWLTVVALFLGAEAEAAEQFAAIERAYGELATRATATETRPTVLIGAPFRGIWYVPGGQSHLAIMLRDAGGDYAWADDTSTGSIPLDLETVVAQAAGADYWLNCGTWISREQALAEDSRYQTFAAFEAGRLYNNTRTLQPNGANDYWETAYARPDLLLQDLVHILHPELLPEHELRWYEELK